MAKNYYNSRNNKNLDLTFLQKEILDAINFDNIDKLNDIGGVHQLDLNFQI